jgi:hypothetical protein
VSCCAAIPKPKESCSAYLRRTRGDPQGQGA